MAPAVDNIELSDLDWWTGGLDERAAAFAARWRAAVSVRSTGRVMTRAS